MAKQKPEYMTVEQTADYLHCCTKTIRKDIHSLKYPYKQHGRRILINRHDVDKYLDNTTYWGQFIK